MKNFWHRKKRLISVPKTVFAARVRQRKKQGPFFGVASRRRHWKTGLGRCVWGSGRHFFLCVLFFARQRQERIYLYLLFSPSLIPSSKKNELGRNNCNGDDNGSSASTGPYISTIIVVCGYAFDRCYNSNDNDNGTGGPLVGPASA